jgi:serine/threonine protein kinase
VTDRVFGKYEIQRRLAIGGMGEVFYAVQKGVPGFERPVILKSLLPELAAQPDFVEQFLDEARVAATLNHPNVVSIYEVGHWNGSYFIAMEYIRGRNLSQLLRRAQEQQEAFPAVVAARIVRDAALGLDHAHRAVDSTGGALGIVHRDISPQNIMVRDDGVSKVVDFGIARAANRASARTATGTLKGKVAYMAPEQILGKEASPAVDQFALGVVFWELLATRRLFKADNELAIANMVLETHVLPPSTVLATVPPVFDAVVGRMLDRDPNKRFSTCAQVASEIDRALARIEPNWDVPPVQAFMRKLGTSDLVLPKGPAPKSTSERNFVISLNSSGEVAEEVENVDIVTATPHSMKGVATQVLDSGMNNHPAATGLATGEEAAAKQGPRKPKALVLGLGAAGAALLVSLLVWTLLPTAKAPSVEVQPVALPATPVTVAPVAPTVVQPDAPPEAPISAAKEEPAEAMAKLSVQTTPKGASIRIDGRPQGTSPAVVELRALEKHYLQLERPGYRPHEAEVLLAADEEKVLKVTLELKERSTASPAVASGSAGSGEFGYLTLDTKPWSKVAIDGELAGSTPLFRRRLKVGKHTLLLTNEGANIKTTRTIQVAADDTLKLSLDLP